jgi:hypothetical protein
MAPAAIDGREDKAPLVRSNAELMRDTRHHLADLLERNKLRRRRGVAVCKFAGRLRS